MYKTTRKEILADVAEIKLGLMKTRVEKCSVAGPGCSVCRKPQRTNQKIGRGLFGVVPKPTPLSTIKTLSSNVSQQALAKPRTLRLFAFSQAFVEINLSISIKLLTL